MGCCFAECHYVESVVLHVLKMFVLRVFSNFQEQIGHLDQRLCRVTLLKVGRNRNKVSMSSINLFFSCHRQCFSLAREPLLKGRISTADLLVLTSTDELLFKLERYYLFFLTQPILIRSTVWSIPLR